MAWSVVKFTTMGDDYGFEVEFWFGPIVDEKAAAEYLDQLQQAAIKLKIKVVAIRRDRDEPDQYANTVAFSRDVESVLEEVRILDALSGIDL